MPARWRAMLAVVAMLLVVLAAPMAAGAEVGGQRTAYVDVSVATLWVEPGISRPVDAPAVSDPSDVRRWLGNMTPSQERWLVGKLETQALYGQKVVVLEERGSWAKVAVKGQPTPRNSLGYPGWVPKRQLSYQAQLDGYAGKPFAQVEKKTALLHSSRQLDRPFIEVSYATRLPVVERSGSAVRVATPDDGARWISASDVSVYGSEAAVPGPAGEDLVRSARTFLGLPYLWAGTSGFGFDCSGFTHTVYKAHGITIPRDTVPQDQLKQPDYGTPVGYSNLQKGDLLYFAYNAGEGSVHHVGMYIGEGRMIHAPISRGAVSVDDIKASGWFREYAGAIRYLD